MDVGRANMCSLFVSITLVHGQKAPGTKNWETHLRGGLADLEERILLRAPT